MDLPPAQMAAATTPERAIVRAINVQRTRRGLARLCETVRLARSARHHSRDMLRTDVLTHNGPGGASFARRMSALRYRTTGETIAWAPAGVDASAAAIVRMWLRSPPHRRELLKPSFRRVGVGRLAGAIAGRGGIAVTADFATAG